MSRCGFIGVFLLLAGLLCYLTDPQGREPTGLLYALEVALLIGGGFFMLPSAINALRQLAILGLKQQSGKQQNKDK